MMMMMIMIVVIMIVMIMIMYDDVWWCIYRMSYWQRNHLTQWMNDVSTIVELAYIWCICIETMNGVIMELELQQWPDLFDALRYIMHGIGCCTCCLDGSGDMCCSSEWYKCRIHSLSEMLCLCDMIVLFIRIYNVIATSMTFLLLLMMMMMICNHDDVCICAVRSVPSMSITSNSSSLNW